MAHIPVKGELGNQQDAASHLGHGQIHFFILIFKDPEPRQLLRQVGSVLFRILPGHSQEHQETGADGSHVFSVHGDGGFRHPLYTARMVSSQSGHFPVHFVHALDPPQPAE